MGILINIDVEDLARAEAFYTSAFGLVRGRRLGNNVLELLGWEAPVYLLEKAAGTTGAGDDPRRYSRHWTPLHLDVIVEDIDVALARAMKAGAQAEGPLRDANWGRIVLLADPFGHGICLVEFSARGYDVIAT